jgi:hypothetical protein
MMTFCLYNVHACMGQLFSKFYLSRRPNFVFLRLPLRFAASVAATTDTDVYMWMHVLLRAGVRNQKM